MYKVIFTKQAQKDAILASLKGLRPKIEILLKILHRNPYQSPPRFEKLVGDLSGVYSRRINIHHRLIYQIYEKQRIVKVIRMWTHYE